MKVLRAKSAGFCYGVKRAVSILENLVNKGEKPIYTLGPIIHNSFVVERFREMGVVPVESPDGILDGTVVIRAHGVDRKLEEELRKRRVKVVDATCPFVKRAQTSLEALEVEGYAPIIVGERSHAEVKGIMSYAEKALVVEGEGEVEEAIKKLKKLNVSKVGIVSQTTQPMERFLEVVSRFVEAFREVKVVNTICSATRERQEGARELAGSVDVMLVVGDVKSRNTRKLYEICRAVNPRTHFVTSHRDLNPQWFTSCESVGITAGASTPEEIISQVEEQLKNMGG